MQAPILELRNIGKIYVSDNNVAVGIRGVNLAFDRGEFVAVTGKSGSGKSTLLNVISGMDTYEEGELLVEGEPTSHYLQKDWEEYRKQYISFIFQEYNIIESFTVLQNVEYALKIRKENKSAAARKQVVVADRHPFVYLFHDLNLTCLAAFPGCSSETSASFETQAKLIEYTKKWELLYIFVMEGSDGKVARVVADETGAEILTLNSLQVVTDYENTTYISAMRQNLENLKKALQ